MTSTVTYPSFDHWHIDLMDGDKDLWDYLHSVELGYEGHFVASLWAAMSRADSSNKRRLYEAFPEKFNP